MCYDKCHVVSIENELGENEDEDVLSVHGVANPDHWMA